MVMGSWSEKCLLGFGFIGIFTGISWDFVLFFFSENSWKQRDGMGFDATFRWNRMKLIEDLMGNQWDMFRYTGKPPGVIVGMSTI